jgi:hypothetical protein
MTGAEHDPLDPIAQERNSARVAEEERLQREREANDLRYVMNSKPGRRFVYRLLSGAGLYRLSFNADSDRVTAFNEGARNRGLELLSEIMAACPERYTEMLVEQKEAKERNDNRNADPRNRRRG